MFRTEYLFREGNVDHWLVIQQPLIEYFPRELTVGESVTLLVMWVGAHYEGADVTWAFIVNEFTSS